MTNSNKNIKFSVIVPVYNCEKYIREALNSIQNQTYKNLEAIIVDDGSNDGSKQEIEKFADKYKNFKFIKQDHKGVSKARLNGLKHSNGNYVVFLDADDTLANNCLQEFENIITSNDFPQLIIGNYNYWLSENSLIQAEFIYPKGAYNRKRMQELLFPSIFNFKFPLGICRIIAQHSFIQDFYIETNLPIYEDRLLAHSLLWNSQNIYLNSNPTYNYRLFNNDSAFSNTILSCEDLLNIAKANLEILNNAPDSIKFQIADFVYFQLSKMLYLNSFLALNDNFINSKKLDKNQLKEFIVNNEANILKIINLIPLKHVSSNSKKLLTQLFYFLALNHHFRFILFWLRLLQKTKYFQ